MPRRRRPRGELTAGGTTAAGAPEGAATRADGPRTPRSRTHAPYPDAFRAEAVRLARSGAVPAARIARDLGVSPDTLRAWVRQTRIDAGEQGGLTTEERAELSQLRREVRVLREEREILKNGRARRRLLLEAETPLGYRRCARGEWPFAYWCVRAREKTWSRGGCGLANGDTDPAVPARHCRVGDPV